MRKSVFVLLTIVSLWRQSFAQTISVEVQPAALDQPRINAAISVGPLNSGTLLVADFGDGIYTFNIQAFFDTGASGILLSNNTADYLGVQRSTYSGQPVVFSDVGAVGTDDFNVSEQIHISLAPFTNEADVDNLDTYQTVYNQSFGPVRAQIGPIGVEPDPVLGDLDVFGVPLMHNKVVVMDPKPVNSYIDTIRTEVFNAGNPSIPTTSRHVLMTKGNFAPFTLTNPPGADPPTLDGNPFIGNDPTGASSGSAPKLQMSLGSLSTSGNFLFDTGAAASMVSSQIAHNLNIQYRAGTEGTDAPLLEYVSDGTTVPDQFYLSIGGIGGVKKVAGFFMDTMTLPTVEGQTDSTKNIIFPYAPVLVNDISLPTMGGPPLTLDGIFGMNFLVASAFVIEAQPLPIIGALTPSAFDLITYTHDYDATHAMLGLEINPNPPLPGGLAWFGPLFGGAGTWSATATNWFDLEDVEAGQIGYEPGRPVTFTNLAAATDILIPSPVQPAQVLIASDAGVDYTFSGAAITGSGSLVKQGTSTATFFNSNTYTGQTDVQAGTVVFATSQNIGPVVVRAAGRLEMQATQHFDGLRLVDGKARLTAGGIKFLRVNQLEISGVGQLEIYDHDVIINNKELTVPDDVRDYLFAGRNGGVWNGPGISSSTAAGNPNLYAIGYADNALLNRTTFDGESVDSESLIIQFAYAADANLDGMVNLYDLVILASHWMESNTHWTDADFNYDGVTNSKDLGILARTWQAGVNNPLPGPSLFDAVAALGLPESAVPEPGALALLATTLVLAPRRCRGRI